MFFRGIRAFLPIAASIILALACWPVLAANWPDSEVNPVTGYIETTDSTQAELSSDIRHFIDPGRGGSRTVSSITADDREDLAPRLTVSDDGDTWIVWWVDAAIDEVLLRRHTFTGGEWSGLIPVSDKTLSSRNPEIVHDGFHPWIVYEYDEPEGTSIGVSIIFDDATPISASTFIALTDFDGNLDTMIESTSGHLWVTWIDSDTEIGWSEYDYESESWSAVGYESYADSSIEAARVRIKNSILGE